MESNPSRECNVYLRSRASRVCLTCSIVSAEHTFPHHNFETFSVSGTGRARLMTPQFGLNTVVRAILKLAPSPPPLPQRALLRGRHGQDHCGQGQGAQQRHRHRETSPRMHRRGRGGPASVARPLRLVQPLPDGVRQLVADLQTCRQSTLRLLPPYWSYRM